MQDILKKLKEILPEENFKKEPETSRAELEEFEKKYQISTEEFLRTPSEQVPAEEKDKWISTYETYLFFSNQNEIEKEVNNMSFETTDEIEYCQVCEDPLTDDDQAYEGMCDHCGDENI